MLSILCALAGIGVLLICSEILWRKGILRGEYGRKFVHIIGGSYVAFWPFFLSFRVIEVLSLLCFLVLVVSRVFKLFHAVHDVTRLTVGELVSPLAAFFVAVFARAPWIFTASILFVALADGFAAVIGKKYGTKKWSFSPFGSCKSLAGNLAYIVAAYVVLGIAMLIGGKTTLTNSPVLTFLWLPFFCLCVENFSPYGTDNLTIPVLVVLILNLLIV